jgi:hypothetical protein
MASWNSFLKKRIYHSSQASGMIQGRQKVSSEAFHFLKAGPLIIIR